MPNTTRQSSISNDFWVKAAKHFLQPDGHLNQESLTTSYEELWPANKVAELIYTIACRFDWRIQPQLDQAGITLAELATLNDTSIRQLFEAVFPILLERLTPEEADFGNQIDPKELNQLLVEYKEMQDDLESTIDRGGAKFIRERRYKRAVQTVQRIQLNEQLDNFATSIATASGKKSVDTVTARGVVNQIPREKITELEVFVQKITGLNDATSKNTALKQLQSLLENNLGSYIQTPLPSNTALILVNNPQEPLSDILANVISTKPLTAEQTKLILDNVRLDTAKTAEPQTLRLALLEALVKSGVVLDAYQTGLFLDTTQANIVGLVQPHTQTTVDPVTLTHTDTLPHQVSQRLYRVITTSPSTSTVENLETLNPYDRVIYITDLRRRLLFRAEQLYTGRLFDSVDAEINLLFSPELANISAVAIIQRLALPATTENTLIITDQLLPAYESVVSLPLPLPGQFDFLAGLTGQLPEASALDDYWTIVLSEGTTTVAKTKLGEIVCRARATYLLNEGIDPSDLHAISIKLSTATDANSVVLAQEIARTQHHMNIILDNAPQRIKNYLQKQRQAHISKQHTGSALVQIPFLSQIVLVQPQQAPSPLDSTARHTSLLDTLFGTSYVMQTNGRTFLVNRGAFRLSRLSLLGNKLLTKTIGQLARFRSLSLFRAPIRQLLFLLNTHADLSHVRAIWVSGINLLGTSPTTTRRINPLLGRNFSTRAFSSVRQPVLVVTRLFTSQLLLPVATNAFTFSYRLLKGPAYSVINKSISSLQSIPRLQMSSKLSIKFGKSSMKIILFAMGAIILLIMSVMNSAGTIMGAFLQETKNALLPNTTSVRVSLNCASTRHFSEEVICKLSDSPAPCNNRFVTLRTWDQVNTCFSQVVLAGNKNAVRSNFKASIDADYYFKHSLQCVGFVTGIEAGLGYPFPQRPTATAYLSSAPNGYKLIKTGRPAVNPGDIVVFDWLIAGHMAVVVSDNGGTITVAEANGFTGEIRLVSYPFIKLGDKSGNPDGVLVRGGTGGGGGGSTFD